MKKLLLMACVLITFASCTQVTPQEEGFKVSNSGNYRGIDSLPLLTGWNMYFPGVSYIVTMPMMIQHIVWTESKTEGSEENQEITVACMKGAGFKMDVGFNYAVLPGKGYKVWYKYKTDNLQSITDTYLRTIVRGTMQDISGKMTVDSMLNNLPEYEENVRKLLSVRLNVLGFSQEGFNILSIPRPTDPALTKSINDKIISFQQAQTATQQLQISIANANKQIAAARGDSAEAVIRAMGDAQAIKAKQLSLTPEYIEYIKWSTWNGVMPSTVLGNSQTLLNLK